MKSYKILTVHNRYLEQGGEDIIFEMETSLLRHNGHQVDTYTEDNKRILEIGAFRSGVRTLWSQETYSQLKSRLLSENYDLIHVHNFFPLISPSIYYAAKSRGVPVVQSLHNFRLICPNALLFRSGRECRDCIGKRIPWPGLRYKCYRNNLFVSASVVAALAAHNALGTWSKKVTRYIALTEFSRQLFIDGGIPASKIDVKSNFVLTDYGVGAGYEGKALYVGRLAEEKGISVVLNAWGNKADRYKLTIVGDGPLRDEVNAAANKSKNIDYLGSRSNDEVLKLMKMASLLIFPSLLYENFPVTIVEAFSTGLPVITSDSGNAASIVTSGKNGLHFKTGSWDDLEKKILWTSEHKDEMKLMRYNARKEYESKYTPDANYAILMKIYQKAINQ